MKSKTTFLFFFISKKGVMVKNNKRTRDEEWSRLGIEISLTATTTAQFEPCWTLLSPGRRVRLFPILFFYNFNSSALRLTAELMPSIMSAQICFKYFFFRPRKLAKRDSFFFCMCYVCYLRKKGLLLFHSGALSIYAIVFIFFLPSDRRKSRNKRKG